MMVHHIRCIEGIPSVIYQHFGFKNAFFDELFNLPDLLNIPVMSIVESVVIVVEVVGIESFELLSSLVVFVGLA